MTALGFGQCGLSCWMVSYLLTKIMNMFIFDQNEINLLFDLGNLEFPPTMQCLYIVLSGHTTMSDMTENPMVDAKIMNLHLFYPKLY